MPELHDNQEEKLKNIYKKTQRGWPRLCLAGKLQSPIELTNKFAYHVPFPAITLKNFHKIEKFQIFNPSDTIVIKLPNVCYCKRPKLSGACLNKEFTLENIHFHWPSEHVIDGIRYDFETHFVFFDGRFGSFQSALGRPNGITVMAILFMKTNFTRSNNFKTLANAAKLVSKAGRSSVCDKPIDLYQFLPYDHTTFYCYQGSLSTPGCFEHVNWIVFKNTSNISIWDFKNLTTIYSRIGQLIGSNNRQLQKLNDRIVSIRDVV
ncbi:unnamed protein product [Ceutorhynchus assimilis]|uniref:carbonic anhydrase n=1 Tax=Ceutorhynchus assimilis TaxID=467358 RepID=A0A9N9MNY3_9CUCU|nr:unnamed protein product [Ceutorhynchus assimilis]